VETTVTKDQVIEMAESVGILHEGDMWFSNVKDYQDVCTEDLVELANMAYKRGYRACMEEYRKKND
jgi:hypothetical protein